MAGGPTVNIVIAFFLFWGVFATVRQPQRHRVDAGQPVIASVPDCVIPAVGGAGASAPRPTRSAPAAEAGLQPGDVIVSFNGTEITSWDQLVGLIQANDDGEAVIGYERDGVSLTRHDQHHRRAAPDQATTARPCARSASSASRPTMHMRHGWPALHARARWAG